ncbi:uncharacterized protein LOC123515391 [Portunus trituberculatus]|uniref:uncharacterized protein LOC123515391 n=1 Tax=Portunus trituberculatus TaxID=210409 RepID=UPI001E1CF341|nr:uncharacterized protein LOC123515391 [Portunus trituberculatus]
MEDEEGDRAGGGAAGEVTEGGVEESGSVTAMGGRWVRVVAVLRGDCSAVNMSDTRRVFAEFVASLSSLLLYGRESVAVQAMACEGQRLAVNLTINAAQHPSCEADLATLAAHTNLRLALQGASFYLQAVHTERSHVFHTRPGRRHNGMRFLYMALGGVGVSVVCVGLAGLVFAVYHRCAARRDKLVFTDDRSAYTPASSSRGHGRRGEADHRVRFADSHSFKVNMYRSYSDLSSPDLFQDLKDPEAKARTRRTREEVWEESFSHTSQEYTSVRGVADLTSSFRSDEPALHPLLLNGRPNPAGDVVDAAARTPKAGDKPGTKSPGTKPGVPPKPGGKAGREEGRPGVRKGEGEGRRDKASIPPGSPGVSRNVLERMDHLFASALTASVPDMDVTPSHATVSVSELYSFTTLATPNTTSTSTSSLYTHAPTPRPHPPPPRSAGEGKAPPPVSGSSDSLCLTRITFMEMCVWPDSPRPPQGKREARKGGTCQDGK